MNTSVIIHKKKDHDVPKGYLQEALKKCPTCFGIAVRDTNDGNATIDISAEVKTLSVDDLAKVLAGCKDVEVVLSLGNMTQDFDKETDLQPFVFQQAVEGEPDPENILAVFMEGDFPNYNKPGAGHTDEFNLWEDFMFPTMLDHFSLANQDVEDFYVRLRKSTFEQAIMNTVSHRAAVVLVPLDGELISFGRNELGAEYDWGTTTNRFGWGDASKLEKAAETAIAAVKKTGGRLSKLMGTTSASPPELPTGETKVGGTTIKDVKAEGSVFDIWPGTSVKTHTMFRVPPGLQGNARNRWIRLMLGLSPQADLPKGKDHSNFMLPIPNTWIGFAQEDVTTNDDVKNLGTKLKSFQETGIVVGVHSTKNPSATPAAPAPDVKKVEKKEETRPASDWLPELSPDEKKGSVDLVTELATNPKRPSALDVQRVESKWPVFSEMMGIKFEDMMHWSMADLKALGKKHPNALALAFSEMRLKVHEIGTGVALNTEHVNDQIKKDQKGHDGTEKKQVEVPPAGATGTAPKKKSRLAQLSGQAA